MHTVSSEIYVSKKTEELELFLAKKKPDFLTLEQMKKETGISEGILMDMIAEGDLYAAKDEKGNILIPSFQLNRFSKKKKKK